MVARLSTKPKLEPLTDRVKSVPKPTSGTATAVVACKLPNGVVMRTFEMVKKRRIIANNMVADEEMAEERGRFTVRGPALGFGQIPNIQIIGGYALTVGVPRDLCETWFEQNRDADMVRNQVVFWEPTPERAADRARELQKIKSGLEALDPNAAGAALGLGKITKANLNDDDMGRAIANS